MNRPRLLILVLSLAFIAAGGGLLVRLKAVQRLGAPGVKVGAEESGGRLKLVLPERVAEFTSSNLAPSEMEVRTLPPDTSFGRRLYEAKDGFQMLLTVVMMGTDRTSIHKPEYCLTSQGWQIVRRETVTIPLAQPHPYELPVRRFTLSYNGIDRERRPVRMSGVYVFWFVADGKITASHWTRVGQLTTDLLTTGVLPRWAYISAFSTCPPGAEDATYKRIAAFLQGAVPEFQTAVLPPAGTLAQAAGIQ